MKIIIDAIPPSNNKFIDNRLELAAEVDKQRPRTEIEVEEECL